MKDGVKYIVGKQIAAVIVVKSKWPPHHQVFLVFPDGTRFEFWGENFSCCSGLDQADRIEEYVKSGGGEIQQVYADSIEWNTSPDQPLSTGPGPVPPYHVPAPETLPDAKGREIKAWEVARAAIAKARGC